MGNAHMQGITFRDRRHVATLGEARDDDVQSCVAAPVPRDSRLCCCDTVGDDGAGRRTAARQLPAHHALRVAVPLLIMFAAWFGGLGPSLLATVTRGRAFRLFFRRSPAIVGSPPTTFPASSCSAITHSSWFRSAPRKGAASNSLPPRARSIAGRAPGAGAAQRGAAGRESSAGASKPISTRPSGSAAPALSAGRSPPARSSGRRKAAG